MLNCVAIVIRNGRYCFQYSKRGHKVCEVTGETSRSLRGLRGGSSVCELTWGRGLYD